MKNKIRLITFTLILMALIITGGSFAYWFESIQGTDMHVVGSFRIGTADSVETTFVISPEDVQSYGYLVPEKQINNSNQAAVEEIPLQFNIQWLENNDTSQLSGEDFFGYISENISYDIFPSGQDQALDKSLYASVYDLIQIEENLMNKGLIKLNDDQGISLIYHISLEEPQSMEDYELISLATIVFYFNFEVRLNLYDINLDFTKISNTALAAANPLSLDMDKWTLEEGSSLTNASGETRIFFPMSLNDSYTITSYVKVHDGTIGGYGIFFDTYLNPTNNGLDYGYVLQYDRGYAGGAFIVRPRENGSERNPIWSYTSGDDKLIPNKDENPDWWAQTHKITIKVSNVDAETRIAEFYVDDQFLGSFTYENQVEDQNIYTGFRGWNQSGTEFYSLRVES